MQIRPSRLALVLVASLAMLTSRGGERHWEKLPAPSGTEEPLSQVATDVDGGVWTVTGKRCHFWDQQKREWRSLLLEGKYYQVTLHGNRETGLYASVVDAKTGMGSVYRLRNGKAEKIADGARGKEFGGTSMHVTRDGRVLNLTNDCIRLHTGGEWREWEMGRLNPGNARITDLGDTLLIPVGTEVCAIDADGNMAKVEPLKGMLSNGIAMAWGEDRVIILGAGGRLCAYRSPSFEAIDVHAADQLVGGYGRIADLGVSSDGSAWVLGGDFRQSLWGLYRIAPDGTTVPIKGTLGLPWGSWYLKSHPRAVGMDGTGTAWVANGKTAVLRVRDGEAHPFLPQTDGSPKTAMELVLGPEGTVYVAAKDGLYV